MEEIERVGIEFWEWEEYQNCLYNSETTPIQGWEEEGLDWGNDSSSFLRQNNGGPCGIIMSVQAEYLVQSLFLSSDFIQVSDILDNDESCRSQITLKQKNSYWADAMATMLVRASPNNTVTLIAHKDQKVGNTEMQPVSSYWKDPANFEKIIVSSDRHHVAQAFLKNPTLMTQYNQPGGVLLFAMALIWTRGKMNILEDMDDLTVLITSPFGHVSQELLNLCLTGRAVSNVWDEGHVVGLGGIAGSSNVGYLTLLEALRYVQVGSYYKFPKYPIWVVASSTHFTILFGTSTDILKESSSDKLLVTCKREFDKYAAASQYDGMIETKDLPKLLSTFQPQLQICCDNSNNTFSFLVETLQATLEMPGTNLILWDEFWKTCSRLLMGASLQSVLQVSPPSQQTNQTDASKRPKTDEEYARELQAQFDAELNNNESSTISSTNNNNFNSNEFDAEVAQFSTYQNSNVENDQTSLSNNTQDEISSTFGSMFTLYHYNALRGGEISILEITRLPAEEVVGASSQHQPGIGSTRGDLEDVIRTKWPSCKITCKMTRSGKSSPSID